MSVVYYRYATVKNQRIFYREAGPADAPAIVLLHGFPASSFMFRNLIPALADRYHVIAPDHLGFGYSAAPSVEEFGYTFDALTELTAGLLKQLGVTRYAIYVQDYGAPIGWRLALSSPDAITAIITQNGNGYDAGFIDSFWTTVWGYQRAQTPATEAAVRTALTLETTQWQYLTGVPDEAVVSPDTWHHDFALLSRPGNDAIQLALFRDYATNPPLYPALHEYLRRHQPPVLAVWGKDDPVFGPDGARAFTQDVPDAEVHLLDGGHFLLESAGDQVAELIRDFLGRVLLPHNPAPDAALAVVTGPRKGVRMTSDITVVLTHGAWADGSSWGKVISAVEAAGVRAVAAPLPLTSLRDDVAALDRTLEHVVGPVVLAGHAYAGGVIGSTQAANVRALVYVAALAPDEGETVGEVFGRGTPHPAAPALAPDEHGFIWLPDEAFPAAFAHRASAQEQTLLRAVQRPISVSCITAPVGRPLWKDRPSWYLLAEEDRMIPAENQRFMAHRMGATVRVHPVDHAPLVTAPDVVVDLLLEIVKKVR